MNKPLAITFNTHNRTKGACYCLDYLIKNLKYDGDLYFYICDDRSDAGHTDKLQDVFKENNITNYKIITCTKNHWGYGYVLNQAIKEALAYTDVVLTAEDDRLLYEPLDFTPLVQILRNGDGEYAGIRVASDDNRFQKIDAVENLPENIKRFRSPGHKYKHCYNLQCMLRHKKIL